MVNTLKFLISNMSFTDGYGGVYNVLKVPSIVYKFKNLRIIEICIKVILKIDQY